MKELQAALKGFTQKNETLKLETKVRLREVLVTFTCMLHLVQVNSVVAKYQGSVLIAIKGSVSWPPIKYNGLKTTHYFSSRYASMLRNKLQVLLSILLYL